MLVEEWLLAGPSRASPSAAARTLMQVLSLACGRPVSGRSTQGSETKSKQGNKLSSVSYLIMFLWRGLWHPAGEQGGP